MRSLAIAAPAKVNLFLGVGALRPDGFHDVTTVLHALELADVVRLTPGDSLTLACDVDLGIPAEQNLGYRAAQAFSDAFEVDVLLEIEIEKYIPSGAGLGGGSSDGAAVLFGLAHWAGLPLDDARLLTIARSLGADCAFLLVGGPALMRGRGDMLEDRLPAIAAPVVLVKPSSAVSTAEAYRAFDGAPMPPGEPQDVIDALRTGDMGALAQSLANNMTAASSMLVPGIADALAWLREQDGVLGAQMAGSGSAVFAVCTDPAAAERIATDAGVRGWWSAATSTRAGSLAVLGEEVPM